MTQATLMTTRKKKSESPSQRSVERSLLSSKPNQELEKETGFRKAGGGGGWGLNEKKLQEFVWTANLLNCNDDNNVRSPPKERQSEERTNRTSSVAFSGCFSPVTYSFYFIPLVFVAGVQGARAVLALH